MILNRTFLRTLGDDIVEVMLQKKYILTSKKGVLQDGEERSG